MNGKVSRVLDVQCSRSMYKMNGRKEGSDPGFAVIISDPIMKRGSKGGKSHQTISPKEAHEILFTVNSYLGYY
jgi:hypothetical protein